MELIKVLIVFILKFFLVIAHQNNLAWHGGPLHMECEHSSDILRGTGQYINENVIAVKALSFNDAIFIVTPRLKPGILASIWKLVQGRKGVELDPYPNMAAHAKYDCNAIQNAVDAYIDNLGNLWVLDSGIIETMEKPFCTCHPKVVMISLLLGKITKNIDLSLVTQPISILQNIVIDYEMGLKPFAFISDASRGAVVVFDVMAETGWTVVVSQPSTGLQLVLAKHNLLNSVLILSRVQHSGIIELDTSALKSKGVPSTLKVFGERNPPIVLLGSDSSHVFLRQATCTDVTSWDTKLPLNMSCLQNIHSPGPRLTPTSVTADPVKHLLMILDSNYGDTVLVNAATYHRISFIGQI